jgi:cytochrome c biogenesis factor
MWILKGVLLGAGMFAAGFMLYLAAFSGKMAWHDPNPSTDQTAGFDASTLVQHVFLHSPLFYAAFVGALLIGCAMVAFWPSGRIQVP